MQDLRDKLLRAGLVSKKQAREVKTEKRRARRARGGRDLADKELQAQKERFRQKQQTQAERVQKLQQQLNEDRARKEAQERIRSLIRSHALARLSGNDRPFYFMGRDRRIRRLHISFAMAQRLLAGQLALAEVDDDPGRDYAVIEGEAAHRLEELDRSRLLFWNKPGAGEGDLPAYGAGGGAGGGC